MRNSECGIKETSSDNFQLGVIFGPSTALAEVLHPRVDHRRILLVDDVFFHEHGRPDADGDRDGVARPGIDMEFLAVLEEIERGVKGVVDQVADDHAGDFYFEPVEDADDQVMGEGACGLDVAHGHGDGIAFRGPDPDRKYFVAALILQYHDIAAVPVVEQDRIYIHLDPHTGLLNLS